MRCVVWMARANIATQRRRVMTTTTTEAANSVVGSVKSIYRYPVKSMLGEELTEVYVTESGVIGDHLFAIVDIETGKLGSAKNPRKWGHLLKYRAEYVEEPQLGGDIPAVRITFPDGSVALSTDADIDAMLSASMDIEVKLARMDTVENVKSEMIWLEMLGENGFSKDAETNEHGERQIDWDLYAPPGRSYDLGGLHVLTTSSLAHAASLNGDATFDARRYRPNFVLDTDEIGFVETGWSDKSLDLGALASNVVMQTVRCIMTTLGREELPVDRGTLRTLVKQNTLTVEPFGDWACLGVYTNVTTPGYVKVGSAASVGDPHPTED